MQEALPSSGTTSRWGRGFDLVFGVLLLLSVLPLALLGVAGYVQAAWSWGRAYELSLTVLGSVGAIGCLVNAVALLQTNPSPNAFRVAGALLILAGLPGVLLTASELLASVSSGGRAELLVLAGVAIVSVMLGVGAVLDSAKRPGWMLRALSLPVLPAMLAVVSLLFS